MRTMRTGYPVKSMSLHVCMVFMAFFSMQGNSVSSFVPSPQRKYLSPYPIKNHPLQTLKTNNPMKIQLFKSQKDELDEKTISFEADIKDKLTIDRSYDNMGPLSTIAEKLDDVTGDWALSYADLSPTTPKTPVGVAFLATNACYAFAGLALGIRGDFVLGGLTEIAGAVSFWYHYSQLEFGKDRSEVRLALLVDYFTAGSALITGGAYMSQIGITAVPIEALAVGGLSIVCLGLCWVWEFGYPYLFWHSLWHILSALTGYLVGQAHLDTVAIY